MGVGTLLAIRVTCEMIESTSETAEEIGRPVRRDSTIETTDEIVGSAGREGVGNPEITDSTTEITEAAGTSLAILVAWDTIESISVTIEETGRPEMMELMTEITEGTAESIGPRVAVGVGSPDMIDSTIETILGVGKAVAKVST